MKQVTLYGIAHVDGKSKLGMHVSSRCCLGNERTAEGHFVFTSIEDAERVIFGGTPVENAAMKAAWVIVPLVYMVEPGIPRFDELLLTTRAETVLYNAGITSTQALIGYNISSLRGFMGMGTKTLNEIIAKLAQYEITLKP